MYIIILVNYFESYFKAVKYLHLCDNSILKINLQYQSEN